MARELFIYLDHVDSNSDAPAVGRWLVCKDGKPLGNMIEGSLVSAAKAAGSARVIVVVPGEDVVLTEVELPGTNKQKLMRALPYALEDQLIDDVDDLHFILGPRQGVNRYIVGIVDREKMAAWLSVCESLGLRPNLMVPDTLALSTSVGTWTILLDKQRAVVRTGIYSGLAVDQENLNLLLAATITDADGVLPERIDIVDCRSTPAKADDWNLDSGIELHINDFGQDNLVWLATHFDYENPINLLAGDFSRKEQITRHLRKWYPAAAMFALWLFWQITIGIIDYAFYSNESDKLSKEIEKIYRTTFPDSNNIPKGQAYLLMTQKYRVMKQKSGVDDTSFSEMLVKLAPVLRSAAGMQLKSLRYINGKIDIELVVRDANTFNQMQQKLVNQSGFKVEILSAGKKGKLYAGRIQLKSS